MKTPYYEPSVGVMAFDVACLLDILGGLRNDFIPIHLAMFRYVG